MSKRVTIVLLALLVALPLLTPLEAQQSGSRGYLIGSARPLTAQQVRALGDAGANVKYVYRNFGGAAAVISSSNVSRVRSLPFVTSVSPDPVRQFDQVTVAQAGATPLPGTPYWLDLIDAEKNTTYTGAGVWVAVLDTGFYPNWRDYSNEESILTNLAHAFIAANGNPNQNQWDVGSDPHGMAVAATIVGYRLKDKEGEGAFGEGFATGSAGTYWVPGVAPGAKIIPIKVCEPIGCFGSAINAAMDYVTSLKVANPSRPIVINESLGGPGLDPVEKAAIDAAIAAGVVIVASAGNSGTAGMVFPAAYEPVTSVGAGGWVGQWANWPRNTWWLDNVPESGIGQVYITGFSSRQLAGQFLDVVSTGRHLLLPYPCAQLYKDGQVTSGTINRTCASKATPDAAAAAPFQYLFISGTSFSAPTVAGIVALMLEKAPGISNMGATATTPGFVESILETSATVVPPGSVTVTHRNGTMLTETWGTDATGFGWLYVDRVLTGTP